MDLAKVFVDVPRPGPVNGWTFCYHDDELELLGGDPALVPDDLARQFAYFVSLRAKAVDNTGDSIEQTNVRAYRLG
ncbi:MULTISPECIES: hypothetical protein [unclassified Crossiella]|uniref:hypothetical protein n=1 Tax=unclassified Crossiella TaxID=2620835 RepID=UPI001FFF7F4E|nr:MULTISPECIES: hypothetical protein [unclassified Crossiella]MCK2241688.1 hypothetical protein [Crossiella sp. S99.2]MCK2255440.1 hypothetical protein [Crossiella sp. S99.1]